MICESPIRYGPQKGQSATGTQAGYNRHRLYGQTACPPCREAHSEYNKAQYQTRAQRQKAQKQKKAAEERARLRGLAQRRPPLPCAICGERISEHRVGEWCRPIGVEAL